MGVRAAGVGSGLRCSAVPVDDPGAVEIVGGQLAANAIAGEDPDPEAAHLAGDVAEHDVVVVELYPKHRVRKRLDHLPLEFDLVLLRHLSSHLGRLRLGCARPSR
jgi:hypothetical protein